MQDNQSNKSEFELLEQLLELANWENITPESGDVPSLESVEEAIAKLPFEMRERLSALNARIDQLTRSGSEKSPDPSTTAAKRKELAAVRPEWLWVR